MPVHDDFFFKPYNQTWAWQFDGWSAEEQAEEVGVGMAAVAVSKSGVATAFVVTSTSAKSATAAASVKRRGSVVENMFSFTACPCKLVYMLPFATRTHIQCHHWPRQADARQPVFLLHWLGLTLFKY